jgi:predicted O-methyltransferase YrrM
MFVLWNCGKKIFQHNNLIKKQSLDNIFSSIEINNSYDKDKIIFDNLGIPELSGGVNSGDQKAIYFLIKFFKPKKILEFGTHLGASSASIALAMKNEKLNDQRFLTVDIIDVNDTKTKHWLKYKSKHSALENIKSIGMEKNVDFLVSNSIDFLKSNLQKYDFIFLDGSHRAEYVYNEVYLSLKLLNKNGIILLHDYFPQGKKIWHGKHAIPGPYMAVKKITNLNTQIGVSPFGSLPWPTKLGTNYTTLALLYKRN